MRELLETSCLNAIVYGSVYVRATKRTAGVDDMWCSLHCAVMTDDPMKIRNAKGTPGGGGGLWLRHVRKIEDYEYSGVAEPRLRRRPQPPQEQSSTQPSPKM